MTPKTQKDCTNFLVIGYYSLLSQTFIYIFFLFISNSITEFSPYEAIWISVLLKIQPLPSKN